MPQEIVNKIKCLATLIYCNRYFSSRPRYVLRYERSIINRLTRELYSAGVKELSIDDSRTVSFMFKGNYDCFVF